MNRTSLLGPELNVWNCRFGLCPNFRWDYIDFLNVVRIGK